MLGGNRLPTVLLVATSVAWSGCASRSGPPIEPAVVDPGGVSTVGLVVRRGAGGYEVETRMHNVAVTFMNLRANRCRIKRDCYYIAVFVPPDGTNARAPAACSVRRGTTRHGATVECPAQGSITFHLADGGTWYGYSGNGTHEQGPCPTANVTVYTASEPNAPATIEAWDDCRETIVCAKAKRSPVNVQADTFDLVRGKCASVTRA